LLVLLHQRLVRFSGGALDDVIAVLVVRRDTVPAAAPATPPPG
jgi:hypothetical protein